MENKKRYNTLFLDRDGVINKQRPDDYVKSPDEFVFIPGAIEALKELSSYFKYILIVTNQRGVGRGLMSLEDLEKVHRHMLDTIQHQGGHIDRIYVCTDTDDNCPDRKPNPGMAFQAKQDFRDIDFSQSWLAGDSISDIRFANNAGIPAVLIGNKYKDTELDGLRIRLRCPDLFTFAELIKKEANI
ncbi:HAD-IIIA family hydrolase [Parabacteroides sp. AM08-6]|uniref:D-glycero-alpha-D-manno-heptose-1,7-bisphosphate 7-phosphatase n=1 Tax=Parabacteroides sp. AM08-6 TaxID=2292053 RepID=UPI000F00C0FB|nr:HAD family hydrolase [Parabacteroides sp. AM08-6]RHJ79736.1 HAD family hydrolase [Parabacteroides sp. AM08-6]